MYAPLFSLTAPEAIAAAAARAAAEAMPAPVEYVTLSEPLFMLVICLAVTAGVVIGLGIATHLLRRRVRHED
jgi:hypothetical protein